MELHLERILVAGNEWMDLIGGWVDPAFAWWLVQKNLAARRNNESCDANERD